MISGALLALLTALVTPVAPPASPAHPLPAHPMVVSVQVHLPTGYDPKRYADLVAVHAGDLLSRDAVRDSIERLYTTNEFSDVVVRMSPRPGGVTLSFELIAQKKLTALTFLGASAFTRAQLTALALQSEHEPGRTASLPAPFFPETPEVLRFALQRAYAQRGYASARITAKAEALGPVEVRVTFDVDEGPPTRLGGLTASGNPRLTPVELLDAMGLRLGEVLDRPAITAGLEKLRARYRKDHHYRARVGVPRFIQAPGERAIVAIPVDAGPEIRFHFHGNAHFDEKTLEAHLDFRPEEVLGRTEEARMAAKARSFYVLAGFLDAEVKPEEVWSPDRSRLVIIFNVDEGLPLKVTKITFAGNRHFDEDFLRDRVEESLRDAVPGPESLSSGGLGELDAALPPSDRPTQSAPYQVDPKSVFALEPYKDALARIVELYRADGFLQVNVDLPQVSIDEPSRTAVVTVTVSEGPQTRVGELELSGAPDANRLLEASTLVRGAPYSTYEEESTRLELVRALQRQGYLFARVEDEEQLSADQKLVKVRFKASPGPKVRVRSVIIKGNEFTLDGVIRSALELGEHDVFDAEKVSRSERNLAALGIFSRVDVGPLDPDHVDPEKDLVVEVDEKPRTEIAASVGGSLVDGPRASFELDRANLFGLGVEGNAQAKINYFNWSYPVLASGGGPNELRPEPGLGGFGGHVNLGLRDRRIFFFQPAEVAGHADLLIERVNRPAFRFDREAFLSGLDWQVARWLQISINNSIEADNISKQEGLDAIIGNLSASDLQKLRFDGQTFLASTAPTVTFDFRDNTASPHSGLLISATAELAHDLGGQFQFFYLKPSVSASVYVPLGKRVVLALSARGGRFIPIDANSDIIAPKRFFLGGASTLRGFPEDGMIPEDDRAGLLADLSSCRRMVNPTGCTEASKVLQTGNLLPSEGGTSFVLYKAELRFPLAGNFEGGLFIDAGDLWDAAAPTLDPRLLRITPGVGLRYGTPVGPIALDVGLNPFPDAGLNEDVISARYVQFSIGLF